jgi:hypothetical protein
MRISRSTPLAEVEEIAGRAGKQLADLTFSIIKEIHTQYYSHRLRSRVGSCPVCDIIERLATSA